jgi:hypothetical protein
MLGAPIKELSHIFCDDTSVVCHTIAPESALRKKSDAIACHCCVQEAVAMKEILIVSKPADTNLSDLMTKVLPGGERPVRLVREWLFQAQVAHSSVTFCGLFCTHSADTRLRKSTITNTFRAVLASMF